MNLTFCRPIILGMLLVRGLTSANASDSPAGVIEYVHPPVFWSKNASSKTQTPLDPDQDQGRRIYSGEVVRCGRGGSVRLFVLAVGEKTLTDRNPPYEIPLLPDIGATSAGTKPDDWQIKFMKALDSYGEAGATLGGQSAVYSPPDNGAVEVSGLVIRWVPSPGYVKVQIQTLDGQDLWVADGVDGSVGQLDSEKVRHALRTYQAQDPRGSLVLSLTGLKGNESRVMFSLLSPASEKTLAAELAYWDTQAKGLMRHVGRAYAFSHYFLFVEAAAEYDAALLEAPRSRDLLEKAVQANHKTGNFVRENSLKEILTREEQPIRP